MSIASPLLYQYCIWGAGGFQAVLIFGWFFSSLTSGELNEGDVLSQNYNKNGIVYSKCLCKNEKIKMYNIQGVFKLTRNILGDLATLF